VQHGLTNSQIAARRGFSRDAVKYHVANAIAKLGVAGRQGLRTCFREPRHSALGRKEKPMTDAVKLGSPEGRPLAIMSQVKP
jgi:regulatory LuxR family protein